jgi:hypothetical protein
MCVLINYRSLLIVILVGLCCSLIGLSIQKIGWERPTATICLLPLSYENISTSRSLLFLNRFIYTDNWMGAADSDYMSLAIVFGVETFNREGDKKLNRDAFNWYFPKQDRGLTKYDSTYEMTKEASQLFFMETCREVEKLECKHKVCEKGMMMKANTKPLCVMKDLLDFYRLNSGRADAKSVPEGVFLQNYKDFVSGGGKWNEWFVSTPFGVTEGINAMALSVPAVRATMLALHQDKYQQVMGFNTDAYGTTYPWSLIEFRGSVSTPLANAGK